ncbi:hypothetical protein [Microcystis phage Mwe-JY26]
MTVKWTDPPTRSSNIAGTTLNSIGNGTTSAFVTYDNSGNRDLYAAIVVKLGSITPSAGGSITLHVFSTDDVDTPDATGSLGGGDTYTLPLLGGAGAKVVVFPMVRLYPFSLRLQVSNDSGTSFAASGNEIYVTPYNEGLV